MLRLALALLLASLTLLASASAQERPPHPIPDSARAGTLPTNAPSSPSVPRPRAPRAEAEPSPERSTFLLADRLLRNGQTDEAIALFEDLFDANPGSLPIAAKLSEAYTTARRWDDALTLLARREQASGASVLLVAERGALLYRAGQGDAARAEWARAVALAPNDEMTYRSVANVIGELRLYADAVGVLESGRAALGDDDAFLLERANLYGLDLQYRAAIDLYLDIVGENPDYANAVRGRLARLMDGEGAGDAFAEAIEAAQTRDPLNRAYRELAAWLSMERKDYDRALDAYRAIDRLEREQGESLLAFAAAAVADDAPDAAAAALDEVLERHPDGPAAADALRLRGQIARDLALDLGERADRGPTPNADDAIAFLDRFLEQFPTSRERSAVELMLAELHQDVSLDFDRAEALLTRAAQSGQVAVFGQARLALGEVAVRRGDLDVARDRYQEVEDEVRIGPIAEQARYELARLDFYEGHVYSALARAEAIDENTAADVTNDAIALRVAIDENAGPDSLNTPLLAFAEAALLQRRGLADSTLAALARLERAHPMHALTDEILFLRAQTLRDLRRPDEAVVALDRLAERVPLSFYRDRALVLLADIAEHDLEDAQAAVGYLDRLLERFPASLFAPQARADLRRLRALS